MLYVASLSTVLFTVLLGVMTPGPSFLMVARVSLSQSRQKGVIAAWGMAAGGTLLSLLALLGMRTLLSASPQLYPILQFCGGSYLAYIGVSIWRSAKTPISSENSAENERAGSSGIFRTAFLVQLSNPNSILFFSSAFASVVPGEMPVVVAVVLLTLIFIVHTAWYSLVALLLASRGPRAAYLRARVSVDRIAGSLIILLGLKLLTAAI